MGYTAWSVTYGEQPSAAKWNYLGANDASFNDGTGIAAAAVTPDKVGWETFIYGEGSGAATALSTFTGWTLSQTNTALFTYSSGVFTCVRPGNYQIETQVAFTTTSAGTTANNEFFLVRLNTSVTPAGVIVMAPSARSSVWRSPCITKTYAFTTGNTFYVDFDVSAGISSSITVNAAYISVKLLP